MKKIDKLIIKAFIGPFVLTTAVVVFIFLMRFLMLYFNDFIGKDLDLEVYVRLFTFFSLITVPISLPLSVLLASLMCFGNLGEYGELTAIKAAGIPVTRVLVPAAFLALLISIFSFFYNNLVNPWANLKGYSLLWDVKTTKLALNIKEGIFFKELPGYRIKVLKKFPDQVTLKGITIYDHTKQDGNTSITLADSGKMYTFLDNHFLVFELFNGANYADFKSNNGTNKTDETQFVKNTFNKNKIVFSLDAFGMKRTDENQFRYHEYMKNVSQLNRQIDSLNREIKLGAENQVREVGSMYSYYRRRLNTVPQVIDSSKKGKKVIPILAGKWIDAKNNNTFKDYRKMEIFEAAESAAKGVKSHFETSNEIFKTKNRENIRAEVEKLHKYTLAFACFVMFLIGASLGSIIKKGGFGMPVLLSISFFIFMYVLMQLGDKYAKEGLVWTPLGVWMPDFVLLSFGIYFLFKARNDARLFDGDVYDVYFDKLKKYLQKKKLIKTPPITNEISIFDEKVLNTLE